MILIISEETERSTDEVIQWLLRKGASFLRINKEDDLKIIKISPIKEQFIIEINGNVLDLMQFDTIWYRRGHLNSSILKSSTEEFNDNLSKATQVNRFIFNEWNVLNRFFFYLTESKKRLLGNYSKSIVNKLITLHIAKDCGLLIPETIISSKQSILKQIYIENNIVTKPISEAETFTIGNGSFFKIFTEEVCSNDINETPEFFPTLVQKNIEKWIELRIFFIHKKFYSMAIFSQSSKKTATDYRNYNKNSPNRMVPFLLPQNIEKKLGELNNRLGINTGSIDMIVTPRREYVFLEVNPVGNIEMVSKNCNYPIEKDIANYLSYERK